jgi:hypothetical protein
MNWPQALIKELASRRCIVFLGSGASAGAISQNGNTHPPKWSDYLEGLIKLMNNKTDEDLIRELISKDKYLDAAEIICKHVSTANYTAYLRETFQAPNYRASKIHESVFRIDPKVVITTNYDEIYDNYCRQGASMNGYNICRQYDNHLISDLRSPIRSVIKAHGCISDASRTILTRSEYFEARQKYSNFYKILDSLFITNTILFVGYSLNDPDIQLVLENSNIVSIGSHPHYICSEDNIHVAIKEAMVKTYNIEFVEFPHGQFNELENGLEELANEVEHYRQVNRI